MKKDVCIIVDFDGTLIEGDLERAFMKYLLRCPKVRLKMLLLSCFTLPVNILRNKLGYSSIYKSWTLLLGDKIQEYINEFLEQNIRSIRLKDDIWNMLNQPKAEIVLLSGCYIELLEAFLRKKSKAYVFDHIIGCTMNDDNFRVKLHPFGRTKMKFVNPNKYNIGIANERADRYYMNLCDEQIYVK